MFASANQFEYKIFQNDSPRPNSSYTHQRSHSFTNNISSRFKEIKPENRQISVKVQQNI